MTTESDFLRAVLGDLLQEKGIPAWAEIFLEHKNDLYALLLRTSCGCANRPFDAHAIQVVEYHKRGCLLGRMLLAAGGQLELDRQLRIGVTEALADPTYWKTRWTRAMSEVVGQLRHRDASLLEVEVDPRPLRELLRAQVIRVQGPNRVLSLNPSMRQCGVCAAVGPMPHYPNCPRTEEPRAAIDRIRIR